MKNDTRANRKLFLLVITVLVTGIMLSVATYAWFTANQTVTIERMNVQIQAADGIEISATGNIWSTSISTADLINVTAANPELHPITNQIPDNLDPVSTIGETRANGLMRMFKGKVEPSESLGIFTLNAEEVQTIHHNNVTHPGGHTGHYVAFDVFLRLTADAPVALTNRSGVIPTATTPDTGIKNATRIAFIYHGTNPDLNAMPAAVQQLNRGTSAPVVMWEPNYNAHTESGRANAISRHGIPAASIQTGNTNPRFPYHGLRAEIPADVNFPLNAVNNPAAAGFNTYFQLVEGRTTGPLNPLRLMQTRHDFTQFLNPGVATPASYIMNLPRGISKLRIYFWVEGQDVDCEDAASGAALDLALQFTINTNTPATPWPPA